MASTTSSSWMYVQLILTLLFVGGFIAGAIFIVKVVSETVKNTKDNLKAKGYNISDNGVSIKTDGRFDREAYIDATQRGFVKAMEASSFVNQQKVEKERKKAAAAAAQADAPTSDSWRAKIKRRTSSHK